MTHNRSPRPKADIDDYADVLLKMRVACKARGLDFRTTVAGLVRAWLNRFPEGPAARPDRNDNPKGDSS